MVETYKLFAILRWKIQFCDQVWSLRLRKFADLFKPWIRNRLSGAKVKNQCWQVFFDSKNVWLYFITGVFHHIDGYMKSLWCVPMSFKDFMSWCFLCTVLADLEVTPPRPTCEGCGLEMNGWNQVWHKYSRETNITNGVLRCAQNVWERNGVESSPCSSDNI